MKRIGRAGVLTVALGASHNAKGRFGPPKFEKAAFTYELPLLRLTARLE